MKMDRDDLEIRQYLKNWADRQPLPVGGRAQLISAAASLRDQGKRKSPLPPPPRSAELVSWAMVYCVGRQISLARIVT